MSWIKSRWQSAAILSLAVAAIAVPAWASSGGSGDVQQASEPSSSDSAGVSAAAVPSDEGFPVKSPEARQQLDDAIQCMTDKGFGTPTGDGGVFIPRSETDSDEFKQAANDCGLPPPPTDAQIAQIAQRGCADDLARHLAREDGDD